MGVCIYLDGYDLIKEKQYASGLEEHTVLVDVAYYKKECKIVVEEYGGLRNRPL